jgi:phosphate transport system substrate-binding protein
MRAVGLARATRRRLGVKRRAATLAALVAALTCFCTTLVRADEPLRVSAPPALVPIAKRIAEAYAEHYGRDVDVTARSSPDGITALRAGLVDVALADSPSGEDGLTLTTIAYIPLAFVADPTIGVTSLRSADARAIFDGTFASWRQVGGRDLVVARFDRPAGSAIDRVLNTAFKLAARRSRGTIELSSVAVVHDVKATPGAIGIVAIPYAGDLSGVRILAIDGHAPDADGARAGYPLLGAELAVTLGAPTLATSRFVAYLTTSTDLWRSNAMIPVRDVAAVF